MCVCTGSFNIPIRLQTGYLTCSSKMLLSTSWGKKKLPSWVPRHGGFEQTPAGPLGSCRHFPRCSSSAVGVWPCVGMAGRHGVIEGFRYSGAEHQCGFCHVAEWTTSSFLASPPQMGMDGPHGLNVFPGTQLKKQCCRPPPETLFILRPRAIPTATEGNHCPATVDRFCT